MKRISYGGSSIITSDAIAAAVLAYTTAVGDAENAATVDITVLEDTGETAVHTLVLSTASQLDVTQVDGMSRDDEDRRFPLPEMPMIGISGAVEGNGDAARTAEDFDKIMAEIDDGLGR